MELVYSLHNYKDKPCLAIYQKLNGHPCGKDIQEFIRVWIHTHKNEGFDYKWDNSFILKLLGEIDRKYGIICVIH